VCILHYSTDPKDRTWNFALEDYHVFMKKLQCLKGSVSVSGLPDYVLKVRAFLFSTGFVECKMFISLRMELPLPLVAET
jgi:hypothetical protein